MTDSDDNSQQAAPVQEVPEGARDHHYLFSHYWLRDTFVRIPEKLVLAQARAQSPAPLEESWEHLGNNLPVALRMNAHGLGVQTFRFGDSSPPEFLVVVEMPPASHPEEAVFAGGLVHPPANNLRPEDGEEGPREGCDFRYYVLEKGNGSDEVTSAFRVWEDDDFVQAGPGPMATVEAFADAIRHHRRHEEDR
jgi:hypothetical protein